MSEAKSKPRPRPRPGRGAPGRRRVPRNVREQQMLDIAFEHFGSRGYAGASMDAIAVEAGITKPMLYSYFGSKEGLFAACADRVAERLRERVRDAASSHDLPPDERLWRGLLAVFAGVEQHPAAWRILYPTGHGSDPMAARAAQARDTMADLLADLFSTTAAAAGLPAQDAEHAAPIAHALTGATIATAQWWLAHPQEPKELAVARLMNFAWLGLDSLLSGNRWLPPIDHNR
jgi:AcrR family transcriptional regulator